MTRIVHLAIKVDDLEAAAKFWQEVFGFKRSEVTRKRGHTSCHLTDGTFDFALVQYDSEDTVEAQWAGPGPRIHHIGLAVEDSESVGQQLVANGCEILSQPGVMPIKFRDPAGIVAEIGPPEIYPGVV
jgi:lactoylglutathione lyase